MQAELLQNVSAVCFNCGDTDIEDVRHFLVGTAFGNQLQNFALAFGQQFIAVFESALAQIANIILLQNWGFIYLTPVVWLACLLAVGLSGYFLFGPKPECPRIENTSFYGRVSVPEYVLVAYGRHKPQGNLTRHNTVECFFVHKLNEPLEGNKLFLSGPQNHAWHLMDAEIIAGDGHPKPETNLRSASTAKILAFKHDPRIPIKFPARGEFYAGTLQQNICTLGVLQGSFSEGALFLDSKECSTQKPHLQNSDYHQESAENPDAPIRPVFRYRHGGKFADTYGLPCIALALFSAIPLGGWGLRRVSNGKRWSGWSLVALALALDIGACGSGIIGCLPWDWNRCLCNTEGHEQHRQVLEHNGDIVRINRPQSQHST